MLALNDLPYVKAHKSKTALSVVFMLTLLGALQCYLNTPLYLIPVSAACLQYVNRLLADGFFVYIDLKCPIWLNHSIQSLVE